MGIRDRLRNAGRGLLQDGGHVEPMPAVLSRMDAKLSERLAQGSEIVRSDSLLNELTGLGGALDKGSSARPNISSHRLDELELTALYMNNGMSRRIIDLVPGDEGRREWSIQDGTEDQDILGDEMTRLDAKDRFVEARRWARLYGGSVVVMVTDDEKETGALSRTLTPTEHLMTPLDLSRVRSVQALHVMDSLEAYPWSYDVDYRSPNFRNPLLWQLSPTGPVAVTGGLVHHSRVLWFRGEKRPISYRHSGFGLVSSGLGMGSRALDDSLLQAMWDEIRNLTSTSQGGASMAQELRESVLKISGFKGLMTSDQAAAAKDRIRLIARAKAILGLILLGEGDEYSSRSNPPSGFSELSSNAQAMLSAVTGIPQTILFGTTPSGLSTDDESGRQTYHQLVETQTALHIKPNHTRLAQVLFAQKDGPTKGQEPESWSTAYGALSVPTQKEEAEARKVVADTDAIYLDRHVLDADQVADSRFGEKGYSYEIIPEDPEEAGDDLSMLDDPAEAAAALEDINTATGTKGLPGDDQPASATALTGVQITSARAIAADVGNGLQPRASGIAMMEIFFNLSNAEAERIMDKFGQGFVPATPDARADAVTPLTEPGGADDHVHGLDLAANPPTILPGGKDGHTHSVVPGETATGLGTDGHTHAIPSPVAAALSPTALEGSKDGVYLTLDLTAMGMAQHQEHLGAVEGVLGPLDSITPEGVPHVTVLYLGEVPAKERRAMLMQAAAIAASIHSVSLHGYGVQTFPPHENTTPVVVSVGGGVHELEHRLLRALAPQIEAEQWERYRPHVTLGFAPRALDGTELAAVQQLSEGGLGWTPYYEDQPGTWKPVVVGELVARAGDTVLARMPLGIATDQD